MFTGLIRTIILYIFIIIGIRLMGKRQVGELEPSELVLSLIIADLASVPMQDYGIPLLTGILPILALLAMTMILSVLTMKSVRFRALMSGQRRPGGTDPAVGRDGAGQPGQCAVICFQKFTNIYKIHFYINDFMFDIYSFMLIW